MWQKQTERPLQAFFLLVWYRWNLIGSLTACLHEGGGPQIGEVTRLGGVTRLSIESLILMWSRLHDRWGKPPHVTSPTWDPPPSCKQALRNDDGKSNENCKKALGLKQQNNNFARASHFLVHFVAIFARLRRETCWFHVLWRTWIQEKDFLLLFWWT